ncbi:o-succinylbenzoate--CoA ligase [Candidatus Protofrankia datiscae]|uniref:O-succinylbenzoate--CoA ligase n=1 Tax=Candidatus Protofrankia datiscae TaxID=2716812 RepID=F8B0L4_9ACTN|nr:o-succinylbenzoate--CoA ligase [Candidatus Protofrankia datiscae]
MSLKYDLSLMCPDVITHNARVSGDMVAAVFEDERLTWRELDERTNQFANLLRAEGLDKGDKVALFMPASLNAFIAFWGSAKAGCVTVPLNIMLDGESLVRLAADSDAVVLVADPETEPIIDSIRARLPLIGGSHWLTFGPAHDHWRSLPDLLAESPVTPCGVKIDPFDIITILYTSGTTGHPKGIEHTHVSRMMYPYGFAMGLKIDRYSVAVLGTPPYASGTWITMIPTMYRGGTVVILRKFTAQAFLAAVERERGTHAFLVPTQWIAILEHSELRNHDVSSLRCIVTSGQPIAEKTYHALEDAFPGAGIHEVYGFSEGFATLRLPADAVRGKRMSVGKPLMLEDIRIIDETGAELPPGESGEIVVHSIGMMTGYYKNPELTEEATWTAPDGRGFMRTGDIGHLDKDGFLYVSGRLKDMIKSGGINIFAVDVEQVFMRHPDVSEAAAIGVPHLKWGETPLVVVIPRSGAEVDPEELRQWANERLARYQRASHVLVRGELPRAVYGKVAKAELRREFGSGAGL